MTLYILHPRSDLPEDDNPWEPWFDKTFVLVVRAKNEAEARLIANEHSGSEVWEPLDREGTRKLWLDPKYTTCEPLDHDGEPGLVIQDFAAA